MTEYSNRNWKLNYRSFLGLLAVSLYPLLYVSIRSAFGEGLAMFAMLPLVPILPFGWFGGEMLSTLAPSKELHLVYYGAGFSIGVFLMAYLCLVNWKYHQAKKQHA